MKAVKLGANWSHLIEYLNTTHVGERMKLLHCVLQDMEVLAKMLASAQRAVSKYRANVPDHLSGHCKMVAGSGLETRLPPPPPQRRVATYHVTVSRLSARRKKMASLTDCPLVHF